MPFVLHPYRRFFVQCSLKYRTGPLTEVGVLCLIFLLFLSSVAGAETLTAVCKEPKGRVIGIEGTRGGNKAVDEPEGMRGGQFTIIWEIGKDEAQVVLQGAGGGPPQYERAVHIHSASEFDSFLVTYRSAVWLYSIFPKTSHVLMTQHTNGFFLDLGGAIAKSMEARCEISLK